MHTPAPTSPTLQPGNPHHQRLGGQEAVVRLVAAFYRAMDTRPDAAVIRAMHAPDLSATQALLVDYLTEWLGGEKRYSPVHGAPMLRRRHLRFAIDHDARSAWMRCMRQALEETCADAALRGELLAAFDKVARALHNQPASGSSDAGHPSAPFATVQLPGKPLP